MSDCTPRADAASHQLSALVPNRPLVFAHRGGRALAPENTLAAFDAGLAAGADGLELDVHLSSRRRGRHHSRATLDRTTDGTGRLRRGRRPSWRAVNATPPLRRRTRASVDGRARPASRRYAVLARYPGRRVIIEIKADTAESARPSSTSSAAPAPRIASAWGRSASWPSMRPARLEPRIPTSASRRGGPAGAAPLLGLAVAGPRAISRVPGARAGRPTACGHAAISPGRPPRRWRSRSGR